MTRRNESSLQGENAHFRPPSIKHNIGSLRFVYRKLNLEHTA